MDICTWKTWLKTNKQESLNVLMQTNLWQSINYLKRAATWQSAQLQAMAAEQWWVGLTLSVHWEAQPGGVACCDQHSALCTTQDFTVVFKSTFTQLRSKTKTNVQTKKQPKNSLDQVDCPLGSEGIKITSITSTGNERIATHWVYPIPTEPLWRQLASCKQSRGVSLLSPPLLPWPHVGHDTHLQNDCY